MKLTEIIGYQLDMARHAALRTLHRHLAEYYPLKPADTTALLLAREQPGCDQATLGRTLSGNRSVGMKVASRLEARGLLARGAGRDRRSKGLYITEAGERMLAALLREHARCEDVIAAYLTPDERRVLLALLDKVVRAVRDQETAEAAAPALDGRRDAVARP